MEKNEMTNQQREQIQIEAIKKASFAVSQEKGVDFDNAIRNAFAAINHAIIYSLDGVTARDLLDGCGQDNMFVANILQQIKERIGYLCDNLHSENIVS